MNTKRCFSAAQLFSTVTQCDEIHGLCRHNVHTGKQAHRYKVCGKSLSTSNLKGHQTVHTQETRHQCEKRERLVITRVCCKNTCVYTLEKTDDHNWKSGSWTPQTRTNYTTLVTFFLFTKGNCWKCRKRRRKEQHWITDTVSQITNNPISHLPCEQTFYNYNYRFMCARNKPNRGPI